jgi:two-component system chemotaxis response regulator CheY
VLLRITKTPSGTYDGVALDHYRVGSIYEVGPHLCGVLLLEGCAELATYEPEALVRPPPGLPGAPVVLVVDDEPQIRALAEHALTAHGYRVQLAPNGREAIRRLTESPPDVILLDLNMPVMDGWAFRAEQQRLADARLASIPVLLLSAEEDVEEHAAKLQVVGVLRKPFDLRGLLNAIRTAMANNDDRSLA